MAEPCTGRSRFAYGRSAIHSNSQKRSGLSALISMLGAPSRTYSAISFPVQVRLKDQSHFASAGSNRGATYKGLSG